MIRQHTPPQLVSADAIFGITQTKLAFDLEVTATDLELQGVLLQPTILPIGVGTQAPITGLGPGGPK
jgi:hypothetical protein